MNLAAPIRRANPIPILFGPIFAKEMAVSGRRWSTYLVRASVLLVLLFAAGIGVLESGLFGSSDSVWEAIRGTQLATQLTYVVGWIQLFLSAFIGIVSSASAISEEKTNRTIASLASTPLTSTQIVFGKLTSRLAELVMLNLLPIPLLLLLRVYGGIDPQLILAFAYAAITFGALGAGIAMLLSAWIDRPFGVIFLSGFALGIIQVAPVIIVSAFASMMSTPPDWVGSVLGAISIPMALALAQFGSFSGSDVGYTLLLIAGAVHLAGTAALCALTSIILRHIIRSGATRDWSKPRKKSRRSSAPKRPAPRPTPDPKSAATPPKQAKKKRRARKKSREVSNHPVLWRESRQMLASSRTTQIVGFSILGAVMLFLYASALTYEMMDQIHVALTFLIAIVLLILAILAPVSLICGEKSRRTWDVLLTTPLSIRQILWQKLIGTLLRPTILIAVLFLHFLIFAGPWMRHTFQANMAILFSGLLLLLIPWTILCCAVGLFWSAQCKSTRTASSMSLITMLCVWLFIPIVSALIIDSTYSYDDRSAYAEMVEWLLAILNPVLLLGGLVELGIAREPYATVLGNDSLGAPAFFRNLAYSAATALGAAVVIMELTSWKIRSQVARHGA